MATPPQSGLSFRPSLLEQPELLEDRLNCYAPSGRAITPPQDRAQQPDIRQTPSSNYRPLTAFGYLQRFWEKRREELKEIDEKTSRFAETLKVSYKPIQSPVEGWAEVHHSAATRLQAVRRGYTCRNAIEQLRERQIQQEASQQSFLDELRDPRGLFSDTRGLDIPLEEAWEYDNPEAELSFANANPTEYQIKSRYQTHINDLENEIETLLKDYDQVCAEAIELETEKASLHRQLEDANTNLAALKTKNAQILKQNKTSRFQRSIAVVGLVATNILAYAVTTYFLQPIPTPEPEKTWLQQTMGSWGF